MSEANNPQNEQELWDVLSEPVTTESKPKTKSEPRFAKPAEAKKPKKVDGFFLACMAGVAAVSVAATLIVSSLLGGNSPAPAVPGSNSETVSAAATELERENAELRAQLELQKEQIKELQNDLMTLMGSEEYLSSVSTDPNESNEVLDAQLKAIETLAQIQEAYADFDRERLEELIPQMDQQLGYLTPEALNNYYLILEYVEQPSNG